MNFRPPSLLVLIGSVLICTGLGTVHGFSVFLEPLEEDFSAGRGAVSLIYSLALVSITAAVLLGPRIFGRISPARLVLGAATVASLGCIVAGTASHLPSIWLSYGVVFGLANGIGYGFSLQFAGQATPGKEGLSMGIVTAAYALGASISPFGFSIALELGGFKPAMFGLSVVLIIAGICAAILFVRSGHLYESQSHENAQSDFNVTAVWCAYGAGVLAGLMAIGHAAGLASEVIESQMAWVAPLVLAIANLLGSLIGGHVIDRFSARRVLSGFPIITMVALLLLVAADSGFSFYIGIAIVGFAYGGTIAAYPAVISKLVGKAQSAAIYGKVFTAWGVAGLTGPVLAGALFDWTGGYTIALSVTAIIACLSAVISARIFA